MNFNKEELPKHIAIIMDGNRRWARANGLPIPLGHKEGAEALRRTVRHANEIGLQYITVYAFSTENWKRTQEEVKALMFLFQSYLDKYTKVANSENIRVRFLGDKSAFDKKMQKSINNCVEETKNNTGVTLNIAMNYGGRQEILEAVKKISKKVKDGECSIDQIDENMFSSNLYTMDIPDPDLLIRTSGEYRTSNFLPWQLVYTEFLFVEKYWPDFGEEDLDNAIIEYQKRNRRFGGK